MSPRNGAYIPDEEYIEKLHPGITRPEDDFLNRPRQTADADIPLAEGATVAAPGVETPITGIISGGTQTTEQTTQETEASGETPQQEPKISNTSASLMVTTAILFDIIGVLPAIGNITSTVGPVIVFGIWFLVKSVPLVSPKKVASWGISLVAEAIPALGSVVPGVTVGVVLIIILTRAEEKTGLQLLSKGGIANPTQITQQLSGGATQARRAIGRITQNTPEENTVSKRPKMVDNVRKVA